jgi:hypothetical protein
VPNYSRLDEVLGKDAKAWPTHCLVQYPSDFDAEIDKFVIAVELAVQGSIFESREVISEIKSHWNVTHTGAVIAKFDCCTISN